MKKKTLLFVFVVISFFMILKQRESFAYVGNGYIWNKTEISINVNDNFDDYLKEFEVKFYYKGEMTTAEVKVSLDKFYYGNLSISTSEVGRKTVKLIAEAKGYSTVDRRDIILNVLDSIPPSITQIKELNFEIGKPFNYSEYFSIKDNYGIKSIQFLDSKVNPSIQGTYDLEVIVTDEGDNTICRNYKVIVRSTATPVLSLVNFVYVNYGDLEFDITKYATASDSYEGDLTKCIKIEGLDVFTVGDQKVTISVANSNGYVTKQEKVITVIDTESPILELNTYSDVIYLEDEKGFDLKKYIVKCSDNCDDLGIDDVIIDSTDFSYTYGSHTIEYKVFDKSNNYTIRKLNLNVSYKSSPLIEVYDQEVNINTSINLRDLAKVSDLYDDAIGESLIIDTGSLDLTKAGKYEVLFEATNKAGNTTYASIFVTVLDNSTPTKNKIKDILTLIYDNKIAVAITIAALTGVFIYFVRKKKKNKEGV